jgi:hypothetical protein
MSWLQMHGSLNGFLWQNETTSKIIKKALKEKLA